MFYFLFKNKQNKTPELSPQSQQVHCTPPLSYFQKRKKKQKQNKHTTEGTLKILDPVAVSSPEAE